MKVLIVSKALVVGAYRRKLTEIARQGIEVVAVAPPSWRDRSYEMRLEQSPPEGYELIVSPLALNGNYHGFFFPRLGRVLDDQRPDLLHIDEEPYNLATFLAAAGARRRQLPFVFFTWQNLARSYPPPFGWMERYAYRASAEAIAGTDTAADVLRKKGYQRPIATIPQFGIDPGVYRPGSRGDRTEAEPDGPLRIGFAGRLVPEKGVHLLIEACARLDFPIELEIVGGGPAEASLRDAARRLERQTTFTGPVPSHSMPEWLRRQDVLVLPSLSQPGWVEQFGRILVEAMACGVPLVVSSCGELPAVAGEAGLVFPEGDAGALAAALSRLAQDGSLRHELGKRGRGRALEHYTHERIAAETVDVYRRVLHEKAS